MAANLAALNNYFENTLFITDQAVRNGLNQQGLTSFDDFITFTEKDIAQICSNVRKPGGVIPNPNAAVPGQPATISNPGVLVGHAIEVRLKMLCYFVKHVVRIQRLPVVPAIATLTRLIAVYKLKDIEKDEEDEDIKIPTPLTKIDEVCVTLEDLDDYLRHKLCNSGCPLAYITRDTVALVPADDPGFGQPSYTEEMIARAP